MSNTTESSVIDPSRASDPTSARTPTERCRRRRGRTLGLTHEVRADFTLELLEHAEESVQSKHPDAPAVL